MQRRPYEKYLDHGLRLWIVKTARANYWRVAQWYDLDDLIQEGFLAFALCKARYSERAQNKSHFMGLFKRIYLNRIHDMANARSKSSLEIADEVFAPIETNFSGLSVSHGTQKSDAHDLQGVLADAGVFGVELPDAEFQLSLKSLPEPLSRLLQFVQSGDEQSGAPRYRYRWVEGKRETNNQFWNRVLGYQGVDFEKEFRAHLT